VGSVLVWFCRGSLPLLNIMILSSSACSRKIIQNCASNRGSYRRAGLVQLVSASSLSHQVLGSKLSLCRISAGVIQNCASDRGSYNQASILFITTQDEDVNITIVTF
jgi:hypothetical protein